MEQAQAGQAPAQYVPPVPRYPLRLRPQGPGPHFYDPVGEAILYPRDAYPDEGRILFAPLMRENVIRNMFQTAGRRTLLVTPVFVDHFAPPEMRSNANYCAVVACLSVPQLAGGRGERSINITIQACATGFSQQDCASVEDSLRIVKEGIAASWMSIPQDIKAHLLIGGLNPPWVNAPDQLDDNLAEWIIEQLSMIPTQTEVTVSTFATGILAICKMGSVTNNVLNKVTNAARDELGINIQVDSNTIRSVWNILSQWFSPNTADRVFTLWENAIGQASLRFRLIIQQASWVGMTNYENIKKAKEKFPDFDWVRCALMFPQDFKNFMKAENVVGDNKYYGYNRDLGDAKSTLYPNLCYVAHQLLQTVGGERSLRDFQGTNRNTPYAAQIDVLIREYEAKRARHALEGQATEASIHVAREFLQAEPEIYERNYPGAPGVPPANPPQPPAENQVQQAGAPGNNIPPAQNVGQM